MVLNMLIEAAFGHARVSILDGGLPRWIGEGNETEVGEVADNEGSKYTSAKELDKSFVRCEFIPLRRLSAVRET